ncbi:potassium channel family protein [Sphingomonas sp.]|uniref:potassium channel family protein n=1 Tax=Sphingomonas sp. TaxID=28214 RepID=UPI002DD6916E|nr:potassium channel family protein [Sphingomonas sp.]
MTRGSPPGTLKRKGQLPVWLSIGWRVFAVLALVGLAVAVHWFDRTGLRDNYDGHVSFLDVVYFTMISITTTGYGDIAPVSDRARMFDALIVTPIRVFVVLLFIGTAYNFVLKRTWDKWRMALIQRTLTGHIVVAGYGETGSEAIDELIARGEKPEGFVVIDTSAAALARAKACGCIVIDADATRDQTLKDVAVDRARAMIVTAGRDDTSILITLTARHLAPDLPISVVVRNEDNEFPARAAGATTVINPVSFAGLLLASACSGRHVTDYLTDLASVHGKVALGERPVTADEVGRPLSGLDTGTGLRLYRGDQSFGRHEPEAQALRSGDTIVEITATPAK